MFVQSHLYGAVFINFKQAKIKYSSRNNLEIN